jgi:hypothetical protein
LIFAREINGPLTSLVKKLDAEVDKNKSAKLHATVVMLSDDESLEKKLKELGDANKNVSFGIDNIAGPKGWDVAKEADVTVVMYTGNNVKANYAFKKGELKDSDVGKIVADIEKILPKK